jgi:BMFP domain-containing protein YqiC
MTNRYEEASDAARKFLENFDEIDLAQMLASSNASAEALKARVAELEQHANELSTMRDAANERADKAEQEVTDMTAATVHLTTLMGKRAKEAEDERDRVQQAACRTAESLRHAKARVADLEKVARGYCPHCDRGVFDPTVEDWDRERKRAGQAEAARDEAIVRAEYAEATVERVRQATAKGAPLERFMGDEPTEYAHGWAAATALIDGALDQQPGFVCGEHSIPPVAAIERVKNECDAIVAEVYGQHDEDDDGMREAVRRIRAVLGIPTDEPQPDPRCRAALAALDQPQRPTTTEAGVPCSLAVLKRPHEAHTWEPQPGMNPVHCPGTEQQPTATEADHA